MNKLFVVGLASLLSLVGCGADPEAACTAYLDAYSACASEAYGVDDGTYDLDASTCSAYEGLTGSAASEAADLLNCYADAYAAADCSTPEGLTAASSGLTDCVSS